MDDSEVVNIEVVNIEGVNIEGVNCTVLCCISRGRRYGGRKCDTTGYVRTL